MSRKIVSVASQVVFVLRQLWKGKRVSYEALFAGKHDRSERVAAFLAVLELVKSRRIRGGGRPGPGRSEIAGKGGPPVDREELKGKMEANPLCRRGRPWPWSASPR